MNKYNIGDKVWYAQRKCVKKFIFCPDCFGKKYLTVIKGDNSQITIDCVGCMVGYGPPKGFVSYWEQIIDVSEVTIEKLEITKTETVYGFKGNYRVKESEFFNNKKAAEIRAQELAEEHNKEELAKINMKEKHNRTWSWNAHYHRRQIVQAEKDLQYHHKKLNAAKTHIKEE